MPGLVQKVFSHCLPMLHVQLVGLNDCAMDQQGGKQLAELIATPEAASS